MDFSRLGQILATINADDFKCSLVVNLDTHQTQILIDTNVLTTIHTNWHQMSDIIYDAVHILIDNKEYTRTGDNMWHAYQGTAVYTDSDIIVNNDVITILY